MKKLRIPDWEKLPDRLVRRIPREMLVSRLEEFLRRNQGEDGVLVTDVITEGMLNAYSVGSVDFMITELAKGIEIEKLGRDLAARLDKFALETVLRLYNARLVERFPEGRRVLDLIQRFLRLKSRNPQVMKIRLEFYLREMIPTITENNRNTLLQSFEEEYSRLARDRR